MNAAPIAGVRPLRDGLMWVDFDSGCQILLDLKAHLGALRFKALLAPGVWTNARAEGRYVRWYGEDGAPVAELSYEELLAVVAGEEAVGPPIRADPE